jgi:hypothetical protein
VSTLEADIYDEPLSSFAFNSNLRRYTKSTIQTAAGIGAGLAALDIARTHAGINPDFEETLVGR